MDNDELARSYLKQTCKSGNYCTIVQSSLAAAAVVGHQTTAPPHRETATFAAAIPSIRAPSLSQPAEASTCPPTSDSRLSPSTYEIMEARSSHSARPLTSRPFSPPIPALCLLPTQYRGGRRGQTAETIPAEGRTINAAPIPRCHAQTRLLGLAQTQSSVAGGGCVVHWHSCVCVCVCNRLGTTWAKSVDVEVPRGGGWSEGAAPTPPFARNERLCWFQAEKCGGMLPARRKQTQGVAQEATRAPVASRGGRELATGEGDEELTTPLRLSRIWWPSWAFRVLRMPRLCEMGAPCMLEVLRWNQREGSSHARNCMYSGERVFVGNGSESLMCFSAARR
ncbi:hypothetical protein B0J12DRAFT_244488 [Macrophomina phaseolina]|uniref:Uncharacterized protein n=1 Tax=Macrophomina phaseolina TaxID=35725 RepID=A0ABQ8G078_9PEZI|nr:hypothetical protein B0J12DRAFT_244488 [Macrophomina phaseolina]